MSFDGGPVTWAMSDSPETLAKARAFDKVKCLSLLDLRRALLCFSVTVSCSFLSRRHPVQIPRLHQAQVPDRHRRQRVELALHPAPFDGLRHLQDRNAVRRILRRVPGAV